MCARNLTGLQTDLRQQNANANATLHIDRNGHERYLNVPVSRKMETDIRKAAYTLYNFTSDNKIEGRDVIPRELMQGAQGLAFITVLKAGFLFTGRIGTGLVVARLDDGSWSAPSAIAMSGMGWGFQLGGELTDVLLVLTTKGAVRAFCSNAQISIGTELAVSLGPVGRSAGTDVHGGKKGASAAFSYAHSKGLFFGVSLEASVIAARHDINRSFYGLEVSPAQLLGGELGRPRAAEPLYQALAEVLRDEGPGEGAQRGVISRVQAHHQEDRGPEEERLRVLREENQWLQQQRRTGPSSQPRDPYQEEEEDDQDRGLEEALFGRPYPPGPSSGPMDSSLMSVALGPEEGPAAKAVQSQAALRLLDELLQQDKT